MGVFFLLMALVVQIGFLVLTRSAVATSMDAAARRSSLVVDSQSVGDERARLASEIEAVAPGARVVEISFARTPTAVTVSVLYEWSPPGPDLLPARFALSRTRNLQIPP